MNYIYVYQTICEVNNKSYIGVHKTDRLNDGYIGCGIFGQNDAKKGMLATAISNNIAGLTISCKGFVFKYKEV